MRHSYLPNPRIAIARIISTDAKIGNIVQSSQDLGVGCIWRDSVRSVLQTACLCILPALRTADDAHSRLALGSRACYGQHGQSLSVRPKSPARERTGSSLQPGCLTTTEQDIIMWSWKAKGVSNSHTRNPGCRNTSVGHEHRSGGWADSCFASLTTTLRWEGAP